MRSVTVLTTDGLFGQPSTLAVRCICSRNNNVSAGAQALTTDVHTRVVVTNSRYVFIY